MSHFFRLLVLVTACCGASIVSAQDTTGDAQRGAEFFTATYKCYACHGFDAQTGQRRLLPMRYTEAGFTTFVQNSPLAQMPAYPDVAAADLADIFAYITSIELDEPDIRDLPLLQSIWEDKQRSLDAE